MHAAPAALDDPVGLGKFVNQGALPKAFVKVLDHRRGPVGGWPASVALAAASA